MRASCWTARILGGLALALAGPALAADPPEDSSPTEDASSQDDSGGDASTTKKRGADGPVLPQPADIIPPAYPPEALEEGLEAEVVVELVLDEEGRVLDAAIPEPVGNGFDEALFAVVFDWRFTPALDKRGRPVSSQIRYAYRFVAEAAPVLSLEGRVREAGSRQPLSGVQITLLGPDGTTRTVRTDSEGRFSASDLADGDWSLIASGPGLDPEETTFAVEQGRVAEVVVYPKITRPWEAEAAAEVIEVVDRAVAPEVTERTLGADEIRYLPGSNGDVVKAVQNLPGIARPPLGIGQLIVRGTAPEDTAYYVDGIAIPLAFHFGGLSTVVPSDAIEEVAFLPGNFGVRYGRVIGGTIDIRTTQNLPERSNGYVSVDLFQTALFAEQKISDTTALTIAGRRSYADTVLNPILNSMDGINARAPRYYDLQGRLLHRTEGGTVLDALFLLSDDRFRILGVDDEGEETPAIGLTQAFRRLRLRALHPLGGGWRSESAVGVGPETQTFEFGGDGEAYEKAFAVDLRQELYRPVPSDGGLGWRVGLDVRSDRVDYLIDVPAFGGSGYEENTSWRTRPAAYVEPTIGVGRFTFVPGVRAGAQIFEKHRAFWVDPRFSATADASPSTRIKLAIGKYAQPGLPRQVAEVPELGTTWSAQTSIGLEQQVGENVSVELTRFYNWLRGVVVGREDAFRFFTGPPPVGPFDLGPYANEGRGRVAGIEASVKLATPRLVALGAATVSRSVRIDRQGVESLFQYDQPIVLNLLASYELPRGWRLGGRARFSSGNPYTPVVNRVFDHDTRDFQPVYGDRSSARLPPFWSLDVRIDKEWTFRTWTLAFYLDVQNATNNQNIEVIGWTYDFSEEAPTTGLPLLPAFGLRASW